jgi:C1A family cysteine protease
MKENLPGANLVPSRLFVYYNERAAEGTVLSDSGAMIRDGIKSVNTLGVCKESGPDSWAYSDNAWTYRIKPGSLPPFPKCYQVAAQHPAVQYVSVPQTLTAMKSVLAEGLPIVFGISVYDSFESAAVAKSGDVPMPATSESLLGGHALLCVGYDDNTQRFIFRNSWSDQWGNKGYGTIPYAYLTSPSLGSDYWAISLVK